MQRICRNRGRFFYFEVKYEPECLFFQTFRCIKKIRVFIRTAYSARTAHPFQRNGAPFRFKLSKAQQVD